MDPSAASAISQQPLLATSPLNPRFSILRQFPISNLGFRRTPPEPKSANSAVSSPVYTPTPIDRNLRTPHSGYHFDGTARVFFEGWYFKVSIPHCRQSFCFMYSVENPAFSDGMGVLDRAMYGDRFTGVGAQILGADDKYICQFSEKSKNFWGSRFFYWFVWLWMSLLLVYLLLILQLYVCEAFYGDIDEENHSN